MIDQISHLQNPIINSKNQKTSQMMQTPEFDKMSAPMPVSEKLCAMKNAAA